MRRLAIYSVLTMLAALSRPAMAQESDTVSAPRIVVVGTVVDTRDIPVDSVQVSLLELKLSVRTTGDGSFSFGSIPPGEYVLLVRRIGYEPIQRKIAVAAATRGLLIRIVPLPQTLPPVVTRASRIGVGGIVLDSDNKPVAGADVTINGGRKTKTDDEGRFFIRSPVGKFLVQVRAKGYATQMISAEVRADSGREVAVWLAHNPRDVAAREAAVMEGLRQRLLARNAAWSRLFTREDINRIGFTQLDQVVSAGSGQPLRPECMATVDGLYTTPIWALEAADLEFVEVYASKPPRPKTGNLRTGPLPPTRSAAGCPKVYAWLRK